MTADEFANSVRSFAEVKRLATVLKIRLHAGMDTKPVPTLQFNIQALNCIVGPMSTTRCKVQKSKRIRQAAGILASASSEIATL